MKEDRGIFTCVCSNRIYVSAFAIPVIIMLAIFAVARVYPFGDRSFLHIDMYHQYFPFLTDFYHALRGQDVCSDGSGFLYSFNSGLGNNFYALWAYYLSSPFNLLALLLPEGCLMEFFSYLAIVKIGLIGVAFAVYLRYHFDREDISILYFSTFYALSGFIAAYNWDLMWLDVVALAPIVILGLERLAASGGKSMRLYIISLAVALFCNYYLCIMLCIFLVLYYLLVLLPGVIVIENEAVASSDATGSDDSDKKAQIRKARLITVIRVTARFAMGSLAAAALSGVILIPSYMAVRMTKFHASSFPNSYKAYFDIFTMSARHLCDVAVETGLDHWPNIYASVAVLILLPIYIFNRGIALKGKLGRLILSALLFYSFSVNVLSYMWHGLNYPDSLPARQSYLYIFLILTISYEGFIHIKEISKLKFGLIACIVMAYLVCVSKFAYDDAITERSIAISSIAAVIYMILLYTYRNVVASEAGDTANEPDTANVADASDNTEEAVAKTRSRVRVLGYIALCTVIIEAGINMKLTSVPTVSRSNYLSGFDDYKNLYEQYNELADGTLYRFERVNRLTNNDAMLKAYPSTSLFSSISNGRVNDFYSDYGMRTSKVFYCEDGMTPLIRALLSDKYIFVEDKDVDAYEKMMISDKGGAGDISKIGESGNISLYAYDKSLPVGYMIYPDVADTDMLIGTDTDYKPFTSDDKISPVTRQNKLSKALGVAEQLYTECASFEQTDRADTVIHEYGYYIAYCSTKKISTLKVTLPSGEREYKKLKNPYIINLGYLDAGDMVSMYNDDGADLHMKLYRMDDAVYDEVISGLSHDTYGISEGGYGLNRLRGSIKASSEGYLILSIPYDKGWSVYVDGNKVSPYVAYGMMTAIRLNTGRHVVELKYIPSGLPAGIFVSLISLTLVIVSGIYRDKSKSKLDTMSDKL